MYLSVEELYSATPSFGAQPRSGLMAKVLAASAGLLGFPPKELQYRFLSQFTSVFYIRQRDYSKASLLIPGAPSATSSCLPCALTFKPRKYMRLRAVSCLAECGCCTLHHQLQWLHLQGVPRTLAGQPADHIPSASRDVSCVLASSLSVVNQLVMLAIQSKSICQLQASTKTRRSC